MLNSLVRASRPLGARGLASGGAGKEKIAMIGSGNFGSALVRILGRNALRHDVFDNEVRPPRRAPAPPRALAGEARAPDPHPPTLTPTASRLRSGCTCTRR